MRTWSSTLHESASAAAKENVLEASHSVFRGFESKTHGGTGLSNCNTVLTCVSWVEIKIVRAEPSPSVYLTANAHKERGEYLLGDLGVLSELLPRLLLAGLVQARETRRFGVAVRQLLPLFQSCLASL